MKFHQIINNCGLSKDWNILTVESLLIETLSLLLDVLSSIIICRPIDVFSKPHMQTNHFRDEWWNRMQLARRLSRSNVTIRFSAAAARVDTLLLGVERVVWMSGGHRWPPPSRQRPASAWATLSGRSRSMFGSLQADRRTGRGLVAATTTRVIHYHAHGVKQDLSHLQHNLNHTSEQLSGSRVYV